jgi:hypothetical protein
VKLVVHARDRAAFLTCRRAWDLSATARRNLEPLSPSIPVNVAEAVRAALAVYYFPGMWDWERALVLPLARKALDDNLAKQIATSERAGAMTEARRAEVEARRELAVELLEDYFSWAPSVDDFAPVRIATDFSITIPDPARPGFDLTTADGKEVRYEGRVDVLAMDEHDAYWIVEHRVGPGFAELHDLLLDEQALSYCWAWPHFYLGMRIVGTIHNELRTDVATRPAAPEPPRPRVSATGYPQSSRRVYAEPKQVPSKRVKSAGSERFRRTWIVRTDEELVRFGERFSAQIKEMISPGLAVYPEPSPEACRACAFAEPCRALNAGEDAEAILARSYRVRPQVVEEGRLGGSSWSMNRGARPPRFGGEAR